MVSASEPGSSIDNDSTETNSRVQNKADNGNLLPEACNLKNDDIRIIMDLLKEVQNDSKRTQQKLEIIIQLITESSNKSNANQIDQNVNQNICRTEERQLQPTTASSHPEQLNVIENVTFTQFSENDSSRWLFEVKPLKSPYYPQIGDDIVYFRQGHQEYLEVVKNNKLYPIDDLDYPWKYMDNIKDHEFVKIINISYEVHPLRVCCLHLQRINEQNRLTNEIFRVKYHDMKGVVDFLILQQSYDQALTRTWKEGDKFASFINERWYFGRIESITPFDDKFPESQFKRYRVKWIDDGKTENMSLWELEPVAELMHLKKLQGLLYKARPEDWPIDGRERTCERILQGIDRLEQEQIVLPFINLNSEEAYIDVVKYPIDIATIESRLKNNFYRRIDALRFDVEHLAKNIEEIKKRPIEIGCLSKTMRKDIFTNNKYTLITEILFKYIDCRVPNEGFVKLMFEKLQDDPQEIVDTCEVESNYMPSLSSQSQSESVSTQALTLQPPKVHWKIACQQLVNTLWDHEDSKLIRDPVDCALNLQNIKEYLAVGDYYKSPETFSKDINFMFSEIESYIGSDKKSKIYKKVQKLKKFSKKKIESIYSSWRSTRPSKRRSNGMDDNENDSDSRENSNYISPSKRKRKNENIDRAGPSGIQKQPSTRFGNAFFKNLESEDSDYIEDDNSIVSYRSKYKTRSKRLTKTRKRKRISSDEEDENSNTSEVTNSNEDTNSNSNEDSSENDSINLRNEENLLLQPDIIITSTERLNAIRPYERVTITGFVTEVKMSETYSKKTQAHLDLLKFVISNDDGIHVQCLAWEMEAILYGDKIKTNQIVRICDGHAKPETDFNHGNVSYEVLINKFSEVSVLRK